MTHPDELQLTGYVDGSLPEGERSAVAGHVTSCEQCRLDVELAVQGRTALASLPVAEAPPIGLPSGDEARPAIQAASPSGTPRWYRALAGVAAAAAIVALVAVIVPNLGSSSGDRTAASADAGAEAEAGNDTPAPQAADAKSVVDTPTDYDAAGLDTLARDQATASTDSNGGFGAETTRAADEATVTCLTALTAQDETLGPTIIVARFEGTPAWIGVYSHRSGSGPVDRVVVRALAQQGCRLLATAEAAS